MAQAERNRGVAKRKLAPAVAVSAKRSVRTPGCDGYIDFLSESRPLIGLFAPIRVELDKAECEPVAARSSFTRRSGLL
jgi:hypothetical protein